MARIATQEDLARPARKGRAAESREQDGDREAAILFPDGTVVVGGEKIIVRELRFEDSLRLAPLINPIVQALSNEFQSGGGVSLNAMREAFAAHYKQVQQLIAAACGRDLEWVRGLNDEDGEAILLTWQTVHMDFFVRRVTADFLSKKTMAVKMAEVLDGAMSSPPSPRTDTTH